MELPHREEWFCTEGEGMKLPSTPPTLPERKRSLPNQVWLELNGIPAGFVMSKPPPFNVTLFSNWFWNRLVVPMDEAARLLGHLQSNQPDYRYCKRRGQC